MELPRHVHKYGGISLIVQTQGALDEALASGWALLPPQSPTQAVAPVEVSVEVPVASEEPDPVVPVAPKRRGRPKKTA